ncbi:hypothetical protein OPT61_g10683 [Boeremia exigua]|uniref:Uncharacterized protein n=1 Tax=Boeremia exigua TaxID=749465 RepID=A0ACC2HP88_9PLEO|nr:hypothetical protein OPT61_g10683 [Boeremia exigua]
MAKKKSKKTAQKPAEVTPVPGSPKPAPATEIEDSVAELTEPEPLAPGTSAVDSPQDEQADLATKTPEAKIDDVVDGPTSEPPTQEADVVTEPIAEPTTETPPEEAGDDLKDAKGSEETAAAAERVEQIEEPAPSLEDVSTTVAPEAISDPIAKDETEAVILPADEHTASISNAPAEAEQSLPAEQQDAGALEVTNEAKDLDMAEPAVVPSSPPAIAGETQEDPQPVAEPTEKAIGDKAPTESVVADSQETTAQDDWAEEDWAAIPKRGRKNKKDKKKNEASGTATPVAEVAESTEAQPVAKELAEKQTASNRRGQGDTRTSGRARIDRPGSCRRASSSG